jgi:hypothetical protein
MQIMSQELDRRTVLRRGTVVASLVTAVACALTSDALADLPSAQSSAHERELPARVAAIVERVRLGDPTLVPTLPQETKIAQWRNY